MRTQRIGALLMLLAATRWAAADDPPAAAAAMRGDAAAVKALLQEGADANAAMGDGMTALHWAASRGDIEIARMLIHAGASAKATTRLADYTPLHLAARNGDAPMVRALLEANADANAATETGARPLHFAAAAGGVEAIEALIESGAEINAPETVNGQTPLVFAAAYNRVEAIGALVARGADIAAYTTVIDVPEKARADGAYRRQLGQRLAAERAAQEQAGPASAGDPTEELQGGGGEAAAEDGARGGGRGRGGARGGAARGGRGGRGREARGGGGRGGRGRGGAPESEARPADAARGQEVRVGTVDPKIESLRALLGELRGNDAPTGERRGDATRAGERTDPKVETLTALLADLRGVVVEAASDGRIAVAATGEADARDPAAELQSRESRARGGGRGGRGGRAGGGGGADAEEDDDEARATRSNSYQDLVGKIGGLTPLLHACRQGHVEAAMALLDAGADVNQIGAGDRTSPLLMAIVNGRFDLAMRLLERGADPNLQSHAGVAPLYGVVNVYWAPHAFYPQPSTALETTSHLEMLEALLDAGADPNARLKMKVWYTGYNFDQSGVNEAGATAFWRAAQSGDVEAMRLLVARGADPSIANFDSGGGGRRPPGGGNPEADENAAPPADARSRVGSATSPLAVAAGAGYDGNFHRHAPYGRLPAVKCMIEEMGFDANERDPRGYTPMHHAAFRGDNEMILYLVSKGGDPKAVARSGETTVDRANGPVQRLQPFPETIALLEGMGAKNNHRAISR